MIELREQLIILLFIVILMLIAKKPAPVENYLRVQPVAPQWVTVGELVVYAIVMSNVGWMLK